VNVDKMIFLVMWIFLFGGVIWSIYFNGDFTLWEALFFSALSYLVCLAYEWGLKLRESSK
jgi:uncharacterized membrane protein YoaK (UPF0700 family)